jgi:hypothetical protein
MPASVLTYLARRSYQDLQLLSERFGDYASSMHYCAEMPTKDPIDGMLSALKPRSRREWRDRLPDDNPAFPRKGRVRSGALA